MVDGVFLLLNARGDYLEAAQRIFCVEPATLIGGVAACFHQEVVAVARPANAQVEAFVWLLVDEDVRGCGLSQDVAPELVVPLGDLVFGGEQKRCAVGAPNNGADALGCVCEMVAGAEVLDVERVLAEAGVVGGVGEQISVWADAHGAHRHEGLAPGEFVHIEQDPLRIGFVRNAASCSGSAMDGVLAPFDGAGVVEPAAVGVWDRLVGLLDVGEHLGVEGFLEAVRGCEHRSRVGVLGLEMCDDLG